jgi:hypothetical protein
VLNNTPFPPCNPLPPPPPPHAYKVFLLEDHEVSLVRGSLVMRGGQRASPADKVGLATITAAVQRAGGSVAHPGAGGRGLGSLPLGGRGRPEGHGRQ